MLYFNILKGTLFYGVLFSFTFFFLPVFINRTCLTYATAGVRVTYEPTKPDSLQRSSTAVANMAKKDDPIYNMKLIEKIEKYPYPCNFILPNYSKRDVTDLAWVNMSNISKSISVYNIR